MLSLTVPSAVVIAFAALAAATSAAADSLPLHDNWAIQSSAKTTAAGDAISTAGFNPDGWYPTSVPSTVLAALVENKVYPDPFYGDNITKIPGYKPKLWLVMDETSPFFPTWWYRTEFDAPASFSGKNIVLHLDGINLRANVWLNGKLAAADDKVYGMHRRFEFDVNEFVRPGEKNCLAIEITAPGHIPEPPQRTKQIEATTGWDDHNPQPPDLNMGIWQNVYLTASGPVALRHPYVRPNLEVPSLATAKLTVAANLLNKTAAPVKGKLTGKIESVEFAQDVELAPGETKVVEFTPEAFPQLVLSNPRVWWPVNLGKQELYDASFSFDVDGQISDTAAATFGIRNATTYINDEGWRAYKMNGQDILIRGGAWMTSDMLLRLTPKRYDALVRYAHEAGLNMLRSEGFSIRETEDFYNTCDKYGVMVTQQIFGRSIPDEPLAIACIEDMMLRIRNHPSLVHFLGHDETFPTPTLDAAYKDLIARLIPDRTYQPHSGAFDINERFETGGTRTGSLQVWVYATPNHYYTSELTGAWGFAQSGGIGGIFAPLESMRKYLPEEALWPPFTDAWSLHTVTQGGPYFTAVLKAIDTRYGKSDNIEAFMKKALALNYESARGMYEAYGRNKFKATGITTWKYDAAWPASPTWQYVDYNLFATGAYYGAKKACEPLHVQYSYDDNSVWVVNNLNEPCNGLTVAVRALNIDLSEKIAQTAPLDIPANTSAKALGLAFPADVSKTFFLKLLLMDKAGNTLSENFYWLSTIPDLPDPNPKSFMNPASTSDFTALASLPPVKLNVTSEFKQEGNEQIANVTLENPAPAIAFFVNLAVTQGEGGPEIAPAFWQDNYVTLLPGEKRDITARFYSEDLNGKTPALKVTGWNLQ